MILLIVGILIGGVNANCPEYGTKSLVDSFYVWSQENILLRWTPSQTGIFNHSLVTLRNVGRSCRLAQGLVEKTQEGLKHKDVHIVPGLTYFEQNYEIWSLPSENYVDAYDKCTNAKGSFPRVHTDLQEKDLEQLAYKYQVNHIFIEAILDKNLRGPTEPSTGYIFCKWGTGANAHCKPPEETDVQGANFRHVLEYKFSNIENRSAIKTDSFKTAWNLPIAETSGNFICTKPKPRWMLTVAGINSYSWALNHLAEKVEELYSHLEEYENLFGVEETELRDVPEKSKVYPGGMLDHGYQHYLEKLYPLARLEFYGRPNYDHIAILTGLALMVQETLDEYDGDDGWITMEATDKLRGHFIGSNKRTRQRLSGSDWLSELDSLNDKVRIDIHNPYKGGVWNVSLKRISSHEPIRIYKLRKFISKTGKQLEDNYAVGAGRKSFTSVSLPAATDCTRIGNHRLCLGPILRIREPGDTSIRNEACGRGMENYDSFGRCGKIEVTTDRPFILSHIKCKVDSDSTKSSYYDILNANFQGEITLECEGRDPRAINFSIGHRRLPSKINQRCSYKYEGETIHGRAADYEGVNEEGFMHKTLFGNYTTRDIRYLIITLTTVLLTLGVMVSVSCCPLCRSWTSRSCLCCCQPEGCADWKMGWKLRCIKCRDYCMNEDDNLSRRSSRRPSFTSGQSDPGIQMVPRVRESLTTTPYLVPKNLSELPAITYNVKGSPLSAMS